MKVKEYLEEFNKMVLNNPSLLECEVIYATDEEGNEFRKVDCFPVGCNVSNIKDDRDLQVEFENHVDRPINAVIVN